MSQSALQVFDLVTKEDFDNYKHLCSLINPTNPFYKIDLILNTDLHENQVHYFLYSKENIPKILMIFISRGIIIDSQLTHYKDVVSPYGYSGPLVCETTSDDELISFWKMVDAWYTSENVITEFIRFSLNENKRHYSGTIVPTLNNVRGKILEETLQWDQFDKKVRNNYRKALQHNLTFELYHKDIEEQIISEFYNIYNSTMKRKNAEKQLFYSLKYFKGYITNNPDHCAVAMVYMDGIPISTEFLLLSDDTMYSYLGGTDSAYFKTRPNDFLKVNVINWGRSNDFHYYVLGGGRVNDDPLYAYKKSFFPKDNDIVFYTGRKILNQTIYEDLVLKKIEETGINIETSAESKNFFPAYRINNISN